MGKHLLLALAIASLSLPPVAATAAVKDSTTQQQVKKKPHAPLQRGKKRTAKKPAPAPKSAASRKESPKSASSKPVPVAAPKVSTDTESTIAQPGDYRFSIQHGGTARLYRVHVPARYRITEPAPLLIALHGDGRSMDDQANDGYYGLITKSEREGFIAVFPNAAGKPGDPRSAVWNANGADDVGFIRQVVTNVFRQMSVDRGRIYATGVSGGGAMAYRLACELPDMFKAVSAVAATDASGGCTPSKPVSVIHFHARNDRQVRFAGVDADGADPVQAARAASVPGTVARWGKLDGCSATPRHILDQAGAYCEAWSWCRGQSEVQLCVTETGGHSWPGGKKLPDGDVPSAAISATDLMWSFFSRH